MSMSAPWTRPGITIVPKGVLKSPPPLFAKQDELEDVIIQKIMKNAFNSRDRKVPEENDYWKRRRPDTANIPCYPKASPVRPVPRARQYSWRGGPAKGELQVMVKTATSLIAADLEGTSDPYVVIECGGQKRKTEVQYKTLDPVWDQVLTMRGILDDFVETRLNLRVFDWDAIGSPDVIGEVTVILTELWKKGTMEFNERLVGEAGGRSYGRLVFSVTWVPADEFLSKIGSPRTSLYPLTSQGMLAAGQHGSTASIGSPQQSTTTVELPPVPVLLPSKFDWVMLTYQRQPQHLHTTEEALNSASVAALSIPRNAPVLRRDRRSGVISAVVTDEFTFGSTTPVLRRPRSATVFDPKPFDSWRV